MNFKCKKGFTLIELIVVVAILAIFVVIVLAALGTARNKGSSSSVKSELATMRSQAEIYYNYQTPNSYGTSTSAAECSSSAIPNSVFDTVANKGINALVVAVKNTAGSGNTRCGNTAQTWAVAAKLPGTEGYWCADHRGTSRGKDVNGNIYNLLQSSSPSAGQYPAFDDSTISCL